MGALIGSLLDVVGWRAVLVETVMAFLWRHLEVSGIKIFLFYSREQRKISIITCEEDAENLSVQGI